MFCTTELGWAQYVYNKHVLWALRCVQIIAGNKKSILFDNFELDENNAILQRFQTESKSNKYVPYISIYSILKNGTSFFYKVRNLLLRKNITPKPFLLVCIRNHTWSPPSYIPYIRHIYFLSLPTFFNSLLLVLYIKCHNFEFLFFPFSVSEKQQKP